MHKRIFALILTLIIALSLCSCVDQHAEKKKDSGENKKVIATSPATVEICNKLDIKLIAVPESDFTIADKYKDLPRIGSPMSPDIEKIKSLSPDYVLSPISLKNELEKKYKNAELNYEFINLSSVDGMFDSIKKLGDEFGREKEAKALIDEHKQYMKKFNSSVEGKKHPKVLVLMGLPGSYVIATNKSYVGSLVELAGGENVYTDDSKEFLTVNTEDMKTKNPDIILRASHAMPDDVKNMFAKEFAENDIWKHFDAVQNGKVYDLDNTLFNMSANFNYRDALEELKKLLYE
ncbi:MAG: heme ABC transporter substrate-binding protein IsdE [[Eubacterium] sulci]|mgnify:FL=1|jgi:heme ABC transporter, heme-binding protein isdE|nr:heme ABC transporter substrate-binding protein IsdE [[Eubacterium] sulci]